MDSGTTSTSGKLKIFKGKNIMFKQPQLNDITYIADMSLMKI